MRPTLMRPALLALALAALLGGCNAIGRTNVFQPQAVAPPPSSTEPLPRAGGRAAGGRPAQAAEEGSARRAETGPESIRPMATGRGVGAGFRF